MTNEMASGKTMIGKFKKKISKSLEIASSFTVTLLVRCSKNSKTFPKKCPCRR